MNRPLYAVMQTAQSWALIPEGLHAEHRFLRDPEGFLQWLQERMAGAKPA